MTKKEIVSTICKRANDEKLIPKHNLTQLATKEIVQWTFEAIIATLVKEGRIELRNFGVFEVKQRKPRKARNPRTGAAVSVGAKNVVTFLPGKEMQDQVKKFAKPSESKKKKPRKTKADKGAAPKPTEPVGHAPSANGSASAEVATATKVSPEPVTSDAPAAT